MANPRTRLSALPVKLRPNAIRLRTHASYADSPGTPSHRPSHPLGERVPEGRVRGNPAALPRCKIRGLAECRDSAEGSHRSSESSAHPLTPALSPIEGEGARRAGEEEALRPGRAAQSVVTPPAETLQKRDRRADKAVRAPGEYSPEHNGER